MFSGRTRTERVERLGGGTYCVFPLQDYVRALREEPEYGKHGENGITLVKIPGLRVMLKVLRGGAMLAEHRAPGPVTVLVLEGEVRFHTEEDVFRIHQDGVLALPAGCSHAVEAMSPSAFLITIAPEGPVDAALHDGRLPGDPHL
ncbi:MAG: cupin domain-containing protein [Armatimonadetes bacterium]|nr:cupin domain-containing protein [Armatimonadota bacterium]